MRTGGLCPQVRRRILTFHPAVPVAALRATSARALSRFTTHAARSLLVTLLRLQNLLKSQIARHLTAKSQGRVDNVFDFFGKEELLTKMYTDPEYKGTKLSLAAIGVGRARWGRGDWGDLHIEYQIVNVRP